MTSAIVFLVIGLVLLIFSAEFLVKGAGRLATALGITPLVVGLTVVAFGTSAPELAVSVMSAFQGQADLALGNVVGSNIFNVLVILYLAYLFLNATEHEALQTYRTALFSYVLPLTALTLCVIGWRGWQGRPQAASRDS